MGKRAAAPGEHSGESGDERSDALLASLGDDALDVRASDDDVAEDALAESRDAPDVVLDEGAESADMDLDEDAPLFGASQASVPDGPSDARLTLSSVADSAPYAPGPYAYAGGYGNGYGLASVADEPMEMRDDAARLDAPLTEADVAGLSLAEVLSEARFRRRVARDYERFLTTYTDGAGRSVYSARIGAMAQANGSSLHVSYAHLAEAAPFLARLVASRPKETLAVFDEATMRVVLRLFEHYDAIVPAVRVRITDFAARDELRDLRHGHLDALVRVSGVVTRRTGVLPELSVVRYVCGKCGALLGPFVADAGGSSVPGACPECASRGPFNVDAAKTVYRDLQRLTVQEAPGSVPAGRLPRSREVLLLGDLVDCARPGDAVDVTGVYCHAVSRALNARHGFPVFATVIEANHVTAGATPDGSVLTEDDVRAIRALARDAHVGERVVASIAPSIHGHAEAKLALALALFGGEAKNVAGKHPIRGDINVLLLGDPGTAKSQLLSYVAGAAPRAVYATGQGASAVGLTACVRRDAASREWTLEGGALVLADRGVCCIDEFDKMNDADRTSIHEAMEQQSISVSKAGIVATLHARASVIAAANPIGGRYRPALSLAENVRLTEPILSRFDVVVVVRDTVDAERDRALARHVVSSHMRSHPLGPLTEPLAVGGDSAALTIGSEAVSSLEEALTTNSAPIEQGLLKKYIAHARATVRPELSALDVDRVSRLYADLRREALSSGSLPITVRHVESIVRLSEARARMHLRPHVRPDDIDVAIRVALLSFVVSQRQSAHAHLRRTFARYLGMSSVSGNVCGAPGTADATALLLFALNEMAPRGASVAVAALEARARDLRVHDVSSFLRGRAFASAGFSLADDGRTIVRSA